MKANETKAEKTVTISLKDIAEHMVVSYQWNSYDDHMQRCAAYQLLLSEEDFNEVCKLCHMMVQERNIKPQVR